MWYKKIPHVQGFNSGKFSPTDTNINLHQSLKKNYLRPIIDASEV